MGIRHTVSEDLYIVLAGYEVGDQAGSFQITVNPLVNWIWFGFTVLALGTGLALLPESAFAYAAETVPAGTATASTVLLAAALTLSSPTAAAAQPLGLQGCAEAHQDERKRGMAQGIQRAEQQERQLDAR